MIKRFSLVKFNTNKYAFNGNICVVLSEAIMESKYIVSGVPVLVDENDVTVVGSLVSEYDLLSGDVMVRKLSSSIDEDTMLNNEILNKEQIKLINYYDRCGVPIWYVRKDVGNGISNWKNKFASIHDWYLYNGVNAEIKKWLEKKNVLFTEVDYSFITCGVQGVDLRYIVRLANKCDSLVKNKFKACLSCIQILQARDGIDVFEILDKAEPDTILARLVAEASLVTYKMLADYMGCEIDVGQENLIKDYSDSKVVERYTSTSRNVVSIADGILNNDKALIKSTKITVSEIKQLIKERYKKDGYTISEIIFKNRIVPHETGFGYTNTYELESADINYIINNTDNLSDYTNKILSMIPKDERNRYPDDPKQAVLKYISDNMM